MFKRHLFQNGGAGLTRRQFLRLAGGAASAACILPFIEAATVQAGELASPHRLAEGESGLVTPGYLNGARVAPPASLGRIASWGVQVREKPLRTAKLIRTTKYDEVLKLHGQCLGDPLMPHNSIWYATDDGLAYSSWIQPVEDIKNRAEPDQAAETFWGEITVPFSDARWQPDPKSWRYMRLYYSAVFRIIKAVVGKDGRWWYRLQDGITWSPGPYVLAAHVRRIDPSELTPISYHVTDKRIEVNLKAQTITAFENDRPVLTSRVASGFGIHYTPRGKHTVLWKTPSSRMTGGVGTDYYDLPGVPFPTYITASAVAIHGTYWHNDYGHPRSHGCLNVPSPVARWFWRWTTPSAPYEAAIYRTPRDAEGTVINVFWAEDKA